MPPTESTPITVFTNERAASATSNGHLVAVGFFDIDYDGTAIPLELQVFEHEGPPTEAELAVWLDDWKPKGDYPFNFTGARDLHLGALEAATQRESNRRREQVPLEPLDPAEIEELVKSTERLDFRSVRDLRSALMQVLATAAYVRAVDQADPSPTRPVADATGTDEQRASQLLKLARRSGYLTPPPSPGKSGGRPTQLAHDLTQRAREALGRARAAR